MIEKNQIPRSRLEFLDELAESIAEENCPNNVIQPTRIADSQEISYSFNNYGLYFDGLLEHRYGKFHVYISLNDRLRHQTSTRARFTFAHELGHYYIDEHRNSLRKGKTPSHPSFNNFTSKNPVELEADHFAASLLMPRDRFLKDCRGNIFSYNLIDMLSKKYNTSLSAALIRYVSIPQNHPVCIVCSQGGFIKWHKSSQDFPFRFLKGYDNKISAWTVAGEYFSKKIKRFTDKEDIMAKEWFKIDEDSNRRLYEKCIYAESINLVMSIIWED